MSEPTPLATKMRALADKGHPRAAELRKQADEFMAAATDRNCTARRLLGAWARARKLWVECSGEPLI